MGDFVGALLKYLRVYPVPRLTLAGGLGKLVKLAQGHLDLHSARSQLDGAALARDLDRLGAPPRPPPRVSGWWWPCSCRSSAQALCAGSPRSAARWRLPRSPAASPSTS